jgi:hypothetical protein
LLSKTPRQFHVLVVVHVSEIYVDLTVAALSSHCCRALSPDSLVFAHAKNKVHEPARHGLPVSCGFLM